MKKFLFILITALVLMSMSAFAEDTLETVQVTGKVDLWEHAFTVLDQEDNEAQVPLKVTLEVQEPVDLTVFPTAEELADEMYIASVTREGLGEVMFAISPANRGLHYNLNDYTDEMLDEYIQSVVEGNFEEGQYTAEVVTSEGGNVYVRIGDDKTQILSTIYDDFTMEFYLSHSSVDADGNYEFMDLTDADKDFAVEIFQGVWTESAAYPLTDTVFTLNVNTQLLSDLGFGDYVGIADIVNASSLIFHDQENLFHVSLVTDGEEFANVTLSLGDDGVLIQSSLLGDKGILLSMEAMEALVAQQAAEQDDKAVMDALGTLNLEQTMTAAASAMEMSFDDNGDMTITVSSENALNLLNALSADIKASDLLNVVSDMSSDSVTPESIDMIVAGIADMLPEDNLLTLKMGAGEDEMSSEITGQLNWYGTAYAEDGTATKVLNTADLAATFGMTEEGAVSLNGALLMKDAEGTANGGCTFDCTIGDQQTQAVVDVGMMVEGEFMTLFELAFKAQNEVEAAAGMNVYELDFNTPDENGNMAEMFSLVYMGSDTEAEDLSALIFSITGYEDPALIFRGRTVFGEEMTLNKPAEIIRMDELNEEKLQELMQSIIPTDSEVPAE